MDFRRETFAEAWADAHELVARHVAETIPGAKLRSDYYDALEQAGHLAVFTARKQGGLCGYAVFVVAPHHQHGDEVWAYQDALYMVPEHRGPEAYSFMYHTDEALRSLGVERVLRFVTCKGPDYSRALEGLGYEPADKTYLRRL